MDQGITNRHSFHETVFFYQQKHDNSNNSRPNLRLMDKFAKLGVTYYRVLGDLVNSPIPGENKGVIFCHLFFPSGFV